MQQIFYYIKAMLPYMLAVLPVIFLFRLLRTKALKKNGNRLNMRHEIVLALFLMFIVGLATQTIIPFTSAIANRESDINLIPFMMLIESYKDIVRT